MSDFNDTTQTQSTPDAPAAFCQHCGRPLTQEMIRQVGPAVYCEPCIAARIGTPIPGASVPPPPAGSYTQGTYGQAGYSQTSYGQPGYTPVNAGQPGYGNNWRAAQLSTPGPNPGLAALLGLIPGVGAMYNEQYAKGVVHLIVFAVLVSLADNVNGIFGLFVAGWEFYMAIEAHHTARARRDGTPLPNPFGLNDIGERLGFGKSWPSGPTVADVAHDAAAAASAAAASGFHSTQPPFQPYAAPYNAAYSAPWGAPSDTGQSPVAPAGDPMTDPNTYANQYAEAARAQAYRDAGFAPPGTAAPFTPVSTAASPYAAPLFDPALAPQPSRFPAGAVVLIGLGVIFLLTTTGIFDGFPAEALVGCVMLGIGAWLFLRRMMETGSSGFSPDGSPDYTLRLMSALRLSVWVAMLGALFLLDAFNIFTWHRGSWSLLIILAGVMAIFQRAASQSVANAYLHPQPVAASAPISVTPAPEHPTETTQGGN